ncbi:hypothetical protein BJ878DRAFT_244682 [Calycina marina]|uniref:ABC transporter TMD0 domain-containing protein n=1 Tax=Calycina marina TaxID=1763456 RepID=A0A9P7Z885_9HELO|nr:hypothetical protein BJ878DRAFT_244682 [Calycina marina]
MMLCSNRSEGFGPKSILSSPLPTSCFTDTVLIPLPVWIALLMLPVLLILSLRHRKQNYNPSTAHLRAKKSHNCLFTTVSVVYYLLIVANMLMEVLEIVRLELIQYGISLIPFTFVGLLLAGALHWTEGSGGRVRGWQAVNGVLWVGGIVMNVIKVVALVKEGINGRRDSKYPIVDQVTDVAVVAGVYAVLAILEVVLQLWRAFRINNRQQSLKSAGNPVFDGGWMK